MKENIVQYQQIVSDLIDAARREEWERIDNEIINSLAELNGEEVVSLLLAYAGDEDPKVKDGVATGLLVLEVEDDEIIKKIVDAMEKYARGQDIYPAGRAVLVLSRYVNNKQVGEQAQNVLQDFPYIAQREGWEEELKKNVPGIENFLF